MRRPTRHRPASVALASLLSALLGAGPALASPGAARRPKVTVLVVGLDPVAQAEAGRLEHAAEQAVDAAGRFESLRLVDGLDPRNALARQAQARDAEAANQAGRKLYDDLDTARAAVSFTEAVKAYRQSDLTRHFGDFTSAAVMRIASLVANGETRAAQNEIEKVVTLAPRAELKPEHFPPDFLKQAEDVRRQALLGSNRVEVKTTPAAAQVYLDGEFKGLSPLTVGGLSSAEHYLSVVAPGQALFQQPVGAGPIEISLREAEGAAWHRAALDRIARDPEGPARDAAAKELGQRIGADQVLLMLARKSATGQRLELTLLRLDLSDGHNLAYQTLVVPMGEPSLAALEEPLRTLVRRDTARSGGPLTHFRGGGGPGKKTVGYVLLGTGVALLAGGAFFGLQANGQAAAFRDTAQTDLDRGAALRQSGRSQALMADLFLLGGLVAAVPGAYLAYSGRGAPKGDAKGGPDSQGPRPTGSPVPVPPRAAAGGESPAPAPASLPREEPPKKEEPARPEESAGKKEAERKKAAAEEEKKKEAERKKAEEEKKEAERKKAQEEKKKKGVKKKVDEDDLRNY